jgi:hypothetical protein
MGKNAESRLETNRDSTLKPSMVRQSKASRRRHVKAGHNETRRNAASCYRTNNVGEPHYSGLMVTENLPAPGKCWVNVGVREIKTGKRTGQKYLSITLKPAEPMAEGGVP